MECPAWCLRPGTATRCIRGSHAGWSLDQHHQHRWVSVRKAASQVLPRNYWLRNPSRSFWCEPEFWRHCSTSFLFSSTLFLSLTQKLSYCLPLDLHQFWASQIFWAHTRTGQLLISPRVFSHNHPSFISLHWRFSSWKEIRQVGKRPFSTREEGIIGEHDLKPLQNLKEPVNFRGNDFVARQGPREIHGQNISCFLGQEMIAHRWNLQWEREWSGPTQALSKGPFHWLYSNLMRAPLALWLAAFSFSSTAFTFSQWLAGHLGLGWALIWQEKGRSTRWPTKLNCFASLALFLNNRPLCFEM